MTITILPSLPHPTSLFPLQQTILYQNTVVLSIIIQMSYHYRPGNRKQQIMRELAKVQNQLSNKNNTLDRLKLQADFYEDSQKQRTKNMMPLADQIINQLMNAPINPSNLQKPYQQYQQYNRQPIRQQQGQIPKYSPTPQIKAVPNSNPRQNNFINQREIQKMKMQNQKHEGLFPNSSDHNKVRSYGKQNIAEPIVPQRDRIQNKNSPYPNVSLPINAPLSPRAKQPQSIQNPFVRDDQLLKQKREQNQRAYLRQLQQQMQQQQRIKEQKKKQDKMFKGQFHDFTPSTKPQQQKPLIMKKADPNSKQPKIELSVGNYSQFDANLIKSKAIQMKNKYKKGKIIYQQYERQMNNLRKQYKGNFQQLLQQSQPNPPPIQKDTRSTSKQQARIAYKQSPKKESQPEMLDERNQPSNTYPIRNQSINYSQFMPSMIQPQQPQQRGSNLQYTMPTQSMMGSFPLPSALPSNMAPQYMEFMRKMFQVCMKQVKQAYSQRLAHQDHAHQQTLNRFLLMSQNNLMTQQIPPIQASQQQRDFYSDAKQYREYFQKESNMKRKLPQPSSGDTINNIVLGQSDNSQYYDKSLSAIASKIPLANYVTAAKMRPKTEKQQKLQEQLGLHDFFNRRYKIKKLEPFPVLIDQNQPSAMIASTSTYIQSRNATEELQMRFQQDLAELKKLQSKNKFNQYANKMQKNTIYTSQRRTLKQVNPVKVGSSQQRSKSPNKVKQNDKPFLKKVASNDENIMTFNERELKINSPINNYSPKSKKEILEQDQYQTEPRVREEISNIPKYIQQYQERLKMPNKALNFIKMNNEILNKYQKTEQSKKQYITIKQASQIREKQSGYFSNNDISPVKKNQNYYEQSLQTIRSDFQSAKHSRRPIKTQLSPSKALQKSSLQRKENRMNSPDMAGYSQTVQSVEESSIKNSRPPVSKRRTISKKKESSIARSKINPDSQISKNYVEESLDQLQAPKFDSNVYQSQYQQSAQFPNQRKINPNLIQNPIHKQKQSPPKIEIYEPTFIPPRSMIEMQQSHSNVEPKTISSKVISQTKLKSLQQARKLAKEYRSKAPQQSRDFKSAEERLSQLQSFVTRKGDESISQIRRQPQSSRLMDKSTKSRKNIMKMLQQLQESDGQNYKQQFESYRQQSEHYQ